MKNNKKQILCALIAVFVLFVFSFVIVNLFTGSTSDKKISARFKSDKVIKLTNKLPITDELGRSIDENTDIKSYIEFSILNPNDRDVDFEIYLTKENTAHDIVDNYIKFYLTDDNDNAVKGFEKNKLPSYKDLVVLNDKPGSKLLYKGTISKNDKNNYRLRVWVSDSYALSDDLEEFIAKVDVRMK